MGGSTCPAPIPRSRRLSQIGTRRLALENPPGGSLIRCRRALVESKISLVHQTDHANGLRSGGPVGHGDQTAQSASYLSVGMGDRSRVGEEPARARYSFFRFFQDTAWFKFLNHGPPQFLEVPLVLPLQFRSHSTQLWCHSFRSLTGAFEQISRLRIPQDLPILATEECDATRRDPTLAQTVRHSLPTDATLIGSQEPCSGEDIRRWTPNRH